MNMCKQVTCRDRIADGVDDPSSLTAQVMKQPFSVVLLDEIEKAAPEVLATLLQLLDEGILRDVKNREVSFRDAIVIATSNAGADRIREYIDRGYEVEQFETDFVNELINTNQFRPEFLNRFDEIVVFRPFKKEELIQVLDLILASVNKHSMCRRCQWWSKMTQNCSLSIRGMIRDSVRVQCGELFRKP